MMFLIPLEGQSTGQIFNREEPPVLLFGDGIGRYLEGPAVSLDGKIYFCDIGTDSHRGTVIWKYDPASNEAIVFRSLSNYAAGLMFDQKERLVICEINGQRVCRIDLKTGLGDIIASSFEGKPFNAPNDLAIDNQGNIYFTDAKIVGNDEMPQSVHGVYRIDTANNIELLIGGYGQPNGIAISPDQKTLYIATWDNVRTPQNFNGAKPKSNGKVISFDLFSDGKTEFRGTLVALGSPADGMTVDADGNIYVALGFQRKLAVYSPSGNKIDEISFPDDWLVTNATYGRGKYNSTLYVTAGKNLYALKTNIVGYELPLE
jgi:gluconolactonase